jgi:uncharacterized protein YndB with AHSA1/START domain
MAVAPAAAASDRGSDLVLRLEREFAAPPERVFAAFTDPELLAQWWGPESMTCPVCEIDLRVGGRWRTCMRGERDNWVSGVYREIVPSRRLAFTWAWEENGRRGHETVVEIDFAPAGPGTRIVLTQREFQSAEARGGHAQGWASTLNCLDRLLKGV